MTAKVWISWATLVAVRGRRWWDTNTKQQLGVVVGDNDLLKLKDKVLDNDTLVLGDNASKNILIDRGWWEFWGKFPMKKSPKRKITWRRT